jgi:RHS repeat-associated protein
VAGIPGLSAYLAWTLYDNEGNVLQSGRKEVPVVADNTWRPLDLALDIDLSTKEARTGTLRLQELNDGSLPVYFDLLTHQPTRRTRPWYRKKTTTIPSAWPMSGVAINTPPQAQVSKDQFNGGSELQDELLGAENGIYSTFYRSYDPTIGRFQGVDPLADQYAGESPVFVRFNDPVNFNDPNGDEAEFVNGRYVTPARFGGEAGGWGGGGREGSDLSHMMQQGWVGVSVGSKGPGDLIYRNGQWGSYALDTNNGTGQYKFLPMPWLHSVGPQSTGLLITITAFFQELEQH